MSMFDFFNRSQKVKEDKETKEQHFGGFTPMDSEPARKNPTAVFSPQSYDDVQKIIDALRQDKTVVVHLNKLKTETAIRVLDMLSGAIYALGGGVYEMEKNIFMFSPTGLEVR